MLPSLAIPGGTLSPDEEIHRILELARHHLGMEMAFLGHFAGEDQVAAYVDGPADYNVAPGTTIALDRSYCVRMMDGRLPSIVPDTAANEEVRRLGVTTAIGIGSYIGVPVRLSDGSIYGTLCCVSHNAHPDLEEYDARFMRLLADFAAGAVERTRIETADVATLRQMVRDLLDEELFHLVFQPIVNINTGQLVGLEALTRFTAEPLRGPDRWFRQAWHVGLGKELEAAAVRAAFKVLPSLDAGLYLSVNLSAETLISSDLEELLGNPAPGRLQVEVTEHDVVEDYDKLREVREKLRAMRVSLAIDDAGAGFANLKHIVRLMPDVIKLDVFLTRDIDKDAVKRALASSLIVFAAEAGTRLIAEGVETDAELEMLRRLGFDYVQGYLLGKPDAFEAAFNEEAAAFTSSRRFERDPSAAGRSGPGAGEPDRRMRAAFDLVPVAMMMLDAGGTISDWNRAAERLFGWSALEARGRPVFDLVVPLRHRAELLDWLQQNRDRERPGEVVQASALHRNGHEFKIEFSIAPLADEVATTFLVFARDVGL